MAWPRPAGCRGERGEGVSPAGMRSPQKPGGEWVGTALALWPMGCPRQAPSSRGRTGLQCPSSASADQPAPVTLPLTGPSALRGDDITAATESSRDRRGRRPPPGHVGRPLREWRPDTGGWITDQTWPLRRRGADAYPGCLTARIGWIELPKGNSTEWPRSHLTKAISDLGSQLKVDTHLLRDCAFYPPEHLKLAEKVADLLRLGPFINHLHVEVSPVYCLERECGG